MDITEIRIKLMEESEDRLRAFCSITIDDCFVIRDLKIIEGGGGMFVAMPSRKLTNPCHRCRHKNQIRATYCNHCGAKQKQRRQAGGESGSKLYADVAHPINTECREAIQNAVIQEFEQELQRFQEPGYRSRYDDEFSEDGRATTTVDEAELQLPKPHLGQPHGSSNDQLASPTAKKNTREETGTSVQGNQSRASDQEATHEATENASAENFGQGIF